jgi:hypothetical protein
MLAVGLAGVLGMLTSAREGRAASAVDYAIYGAQDVTLESYSVVLGDVYAGRDLSLLFGYGIQRTDRNAGDMLAWRNLSVGGLSEIDGNLNANGNVSLEYWVDVTGNVTYGNAYQQTGSPGTIGGVTSQQASTVPLVAMPPATTFSAGGPNTAGNMLDLLPGTYGNVVVNGSSGALHLRAGDYYLSSLTMTSSQSLHLDLNAGQSIRVFLQGDMDLGGNLSVFVNGQDVGNGLTGATRDLAANVLFESHGNVEIGSLFDSFFGTVFAPQGTVTGSTQYFYGSIIAGGTVSGDFYIEHVPSAVVPEPYSFATGACGVMLLCVGAVLIRARRGGEVVAGG